MTINLHLQNENSKHLNKGVLLFDKSAMLSGIKKALKWDGDDFITSFPQW